jgi:hypothetical protein
MRMILVTAALVATGWIGNELANGETPRPECPTEDSCQPQHENGHWTIVEVTP